MSFKIMNPAKGHAQRGTSAIANSSGIGSMGASRKGVSPVDLNELATRWNKMGSFDASTIFNSNTAYDPLRTSGASSTEYDTTAFASYANEHKLITSIVAMDIKKFKWVCTNEIFTEAPLENFTRFTVETLTFSAHHAVTTSDGGVLPELSSYTNVTQEGVTEIGRAFAIEGHFKRTGHGMIMWGGYKQAISYSMTVGVELALMGSVIRANGNRSTYPSLRTKAPTSRNDWGAANAPLFAAVGALQTMVNPWPVILQEIQRAIPNGPTHIILPEDAIGMINQTTNATENRMKKTSEQPNVLPEEEPCPGVQYRVREVYPDDSVPEGYCKIDDLETQLHLASWFPMGPPEQRLTDANDFTTRKCGADVLSSSEDGWGHVSYLSGVLSQGRFPQNPPRDDPFNAKDMFSADEWKDGGLIDKAKRMTEQVYPKGLHTHHANNRFMSLGLLLQLSDVRSAQFGDDEFDINKVAHNMYVTWENALKMHFGLTGNDEEAFVIALAHFTNERAGVKLSELKARKGQLMTFGFFRFLLHHIPVNRRMMKALLLMDMMIPVEGAAIRMSSVFVSSLIAVNKEGCTYFKGDVWSQSAQMVPMTREMYRTDMKLAGLVANPENVYIKEFSYIMGHTGFRTDKFVDFGDISLARVKNDISIDLEDSLFCVMVLMGSGLRKAQGLSLKANGLLTGLAGDVSTQIDPKWTLDRICSKPTMYMQPDRVLDNSQLSPLCSNDPARITYDANKCFITEAVRESYYAYNFDTKQREYVSGFSVMSHACKKNAMRVLRGEATIASND